MWLEIRTLPLLTVNDEVFNSNAPPNQATTEAVYRGGRVETHLETIAAVAVAMREKIAAMTRVFVHSPTDPLYCRVVT